MPLGFSIVVFKILDIIPKNIEIITNANRVLKIAANFICVSFFTL
jgi:hypothetical protein